MNARVAFFDVKPGKREEAIKLFRDVVIPEAKKQKGFKGELLLTAPDAGKGISIGLWETKTDMTATEKSGFYNSGLLNSPMCLRYLPSWNTVK